MFVVSGAIPRLPPVSELSRKEQFLRAIFYVVVPRGADLAAVAPGSGMVASYGRPGHVVVDFEGDLYADPDSGRTYADRVHSGDAVDLGPQLATGENTRHQMQRQGLLPSEPPREPLYYRVGMDAGRP
jgi:hypothetical protein